MFQASRPCKQMSLKRLQWNTINHSDSHDHPLFAIPHSPNPKPDLSVCIASPLVTSLVWVVLPSQLRLTDGRANHQATQAPSHGPLGHFRMHSSSIPVDDEYDPVRQRVHTEELVPPARVESTPNTFTTCSTRSMQTRDAGVCSRLAQGACARVCSTCHSGALGH